MNAPDRSAELRRIAAVLTGPEEHLGQTIAATNDLYALCTGLTSLETGRDEFRENILLPAGKAIGTEWAARCIKDFYRTRRFIRGLYLGVLAAQKKFPGRPIHILYAGTGPFATLALPLTAMFSPAEIQFTMLEINPESIAMLELVIDAFRIGPYVQEIVRADATRYQVDQSRPVHLLLSETMQHALKKEPQVAITLHLAPQLAPGAILIPQRIVISAGLFSARLDHQRMIGTLAPGVLPFHMLGRIFELDQNSWKTLAPGATEFPPVSLDLPPGVTQEGYDWLALFTEITVFETEVLKNRESPLNTPLRVMKFDEGKSVPEKVRFQYKLGEIPGFECRAV